ncbi:DUF6933 domain-containing protein [Amphritea atlantica]|uniref:DUF6933 domain-containing protein n=1 Tax=Amphritea atlantica TaxID=355243 RepID=UPI0035E4357D
MTTIQRRQCIVFTHDQTRFTVALTTVTLKEIKQLDWWLSDMLLNTMPAGNFESQQKSIATRQCLPF